MAKAKDRRGGNEEAARIILADPVLHRSGPDLNVGNQQLLFVRLTLDGHTAMQKAWNILTFVLRLFSADPVFGAHSRFVI